MTGPHPMLDGDQSLTYMPRHAFVWQAKELSLNSQGGLPGALVRTSGAAALDSFGASLTCPHSMPRWERAVVSGKDRVGLKMSTDLLSWDTLFAARGLGGMVEFIEAGTINVEGAGLVYCGNDAGSGPEWDIRVSGGQYWFNFQNGTSYVSALPGGAAPTAGQHVRLRWRIEAGTGRVQLWKSIDGAAEIASGLSPGLSFVAWSTPQRLRINSLGTGSVGSVLALGLVVAIGDPTQAQLLAALS